ncbi:MAG: TlpA disulfide reductase family protein [Desulfocapsaceae bacterium]|nr:TlpA disulfide reductase family protein [Desulfocapsaceae bacterium]
MGKQVCTFVSVVTVVMAVLLCSVSPLHSATKMPSFSLENVLTGAEVDSETFAGKSLLITFFATWCPPCIQEIPNLIEVHNTFGPENFSVVALSVDQEGRSVVKRIVEKKNINYPVMMADSSVTRDFGGVYGIPTSFLVNSRGNVVKKYTGYIPHSVLVNDIKQVLQ